MLDSTDTTPATKGGRAAGNNDGTRVLHIAADEAIAQGAEREDGGSGSRGSSKLLAVALMVPQP